MQHRRVELFLETTNNDALSTTMEAGLLLRLLGFGVVT